MEHDNAEVDPGGMVRYYHVTCVHNVCRRLLLPRARRLFAPDLIVSVIPRASQELSARGRALGEWGNWGSEGGRSDRPSGSACWGVEKSAAPCSKIARPGNRTCCKRWSLPVACQGRYFLSRCSILCACHVRALSPLSPLPALSLFEGRSFLVSRRLSSVLFLLFFGELLSRSFPTLRHTVCCLPDIASGRFARSL